MKRHNPFRENAIRKRSVPVCAAAAGLVLVCALLAGGQDQPPAAKDKPTGAPAARQAKRAAPVLLTWLGQACFVLQSGDTTVLLDPIPLTMGYSPKPVAAGVVTVSHEHSDHNNIGLATGSPTVLRGLAQEGGGWNTIDYSNQDVTISAFPSYHDSENGARRGKNALFLVETQGLRILHTGDLGHTLPQDTVDRIGRVDVLLICVGGFYTIDAAGAKAVIAQLDPRVVVPMHYTTDRTNLPISGVDPFLTGWEDVRRPQEGGLALKADLADFPPGKTAVVVLPYQQEPYVPEDKSTAMRVY